jgi:hypothetical protein
MKAYAALTLSAIRTISGYPAFTGLRSKWSRPYRLVPFLAKGTNSKFGYRGDKRELSSASPAYWMSDGSDISHTASALCTNRHHRLIGRHRFGIEQQIRIRKS